MTRTRLHPLLLALGALAPLSLGIAQVPGWTLERPLTSPSARADHAMAYDSFRDRSVLFSGGSSDRSTWEWNGANWQLMTTTATTPIGRRRHAMSYDAARRQTVLFGGMSSNALFDTWLWNGVNWTQAQPSDTPGPRHHHAMAYDTGRQKTLLFGGDDGYAGLHMDTWDWDGSNWARLRPPTSPTPRAGHAMVHDSARGRTVLFGGYDSNGLLRDTWEFDGSTWKQVLTAVSPPASKDHGMAFDSARLRTVLFGDGTWEFDGTNWRSVPITVSPSKRFNHAMTYDTAHQRTVMFGGRISSKTAETWTYGLPAGQFVARFTAFGSGCGPAGKPAVSMLPAVGSRPQLGHVFTLVTSNLPTTVTTALISVGGSNQFVGSTPLPMELRSLGMPECWLWHSFEVYWTFQVSGGTGTVSVPVPNTPALSGARLFMQSAGGQYTSNGGDILLGNL